MILQRMCVVAPITFLQCCLSDFPNAYLQNARKLRMCGFGAPRHSSPTSTCCAVCSTWGRLELASDSFPPRRCIGEWAQVFYSPLVVPKQPAQIGHLWINVFEKRRRPIESRAHNSWCGYQLYVFFSVAMVRTLIGLATGPPMKASIRKRNDAMEIVNRDEPTVI